MHGLGILPLYQMAAHRQHFSLKFQPVDLKSKSKNAHEQNITILIMTEANRCLQIQIKPVISSAIIVASAANEIERMVPVNGSVMMIILFQVFQYFFCSSDFRKCILHSTPDARADRYMCDATNRTCIHGQ